MKFLFALTALTSLVAAAPKESKNKFSIADPGGVKDIVITEDNTLNGTVVEKKTKVFANVKAKGVTAQAPLPGNLNMEIVNDKFPGGALNMYISGLDSDERIVFLGPDGQLVYPSSGGSEIPVEVTQNIAHNLPSGEVKVTIPIAMHSGRVYFAEGNMKFFMVSIGNGRDGLVQPSIANLQDPAAATNFGFAEFTVEASGTVWSNISFVDFVGLIISMIVRSKDGGQQEVIGLPGSTVPALCNDLVEQGNRDGLPWARHCIAGPNGQPLRAVSPEAFAKIDPNAFANYYNTYVDQAWDRFRNEDLFINTQAPAGTVRCRVNGDELTCDGDNRGYQKPTTFDIWGCNSGPFALADGDNDVHRAVIPRLCAAFYRTTMLLDGGQNQPGLPSSSYYQADPTSHYSRLVHAREVDGKGYAFSYDDVHPDGEPDQAGLIREGNPDALRFIVGGSA